MVWYGMTEQSKYLGIKNVIWDICDFESTSEVKILKRKGVHYG